MCAALVGMGVRRKLWMDVGAEVGLGTTILGPQI